MLNRPNKTCLLGWISAHGWPALSSAAEPQKAVEGLKEKSDVISCVLEKNHTGPPVYGGWTGAVGAEARRLLQKPKEGRGWMAFEDNSSGAGKSGGKITRTW